MTDHERGAVAADAARVYDAFFVPALFEQWARPVLEAAAVRPGHRVLDVACGTGVLARQAAEIAGPANVVGLDPNPAMLEVAERAAPDIAWQAGRAEHLPYPDASFDAVVSQFGLMFFDDRVAGLTEMRRVLRPDRRMAVAVWASIEHAPAYARLAELLGRLFDDSAAAALLQPFALGDPTQVERLLRSAGVSSTDVRVHHGTARFPSMEAWMHTEVRGWTLADSTDDDQFGRLLEDAARELRDVIQPDGSVAFEIAAIIASANA